jgi:hypothetical protein
MPLVGTTPTPQITSPINDSNFSPGVGIRVHVTTNRPDLQSTVWLLDSNGNVIDQVAVTWPTTAPFETDVVLTIPSPAEPVYLIELEQINDVMARLDGGFFVHAIQISVS